jgi:hypothetical protein
LRWLAVLGSDGGAGGGLVVVVVDVSAGGCEGDCQESVRDPDDSGGGGNNS